MTLRNQVSVKMPILNLKKSLFFTPRGLAFHTAVNAKVVFLHPPLAAPLTPVLN